MHQILEPYLGQIVGINARKPYHLDPYLLERVAETHITVHQPEDQTRVHIPIGNVIRILENREEGIHVGGLFQQKHAYHLVIKIGHIVTQIPA